MNELEKTPVREDKIKISDEVVAVIAGVAASEVEYLVSMSGGIVDGIAGMLGRKNLGKGIKVEVKENDAYIDLSIIVQYGCKIHEVAAKIQERVRTSVEDMTGMQVIAVNINILGVSLGKETGKAEVLEEALKE
jgi:Uncharacterized protein conserved in bacteria